MKFKLFRNTTTLITFAFSVLPVVLLGIIDKVKEKFFHIQVWKLTKVTYFTFDDNLDMNLNFILIIYYRCYSVKNTSVEKENYIKFVLKIKCRV